MWPDPQFPEDLVTFTEEILTKNFIFCVMLFEPHSYTVLEITRKIELMRKISTFKQWKFKNI